MAGRLDICDQQREMSSESKIHVMSDDSEIVSKVITDRSMIIPPDHSDNSTGMYQPPDEWLPITQSRRGNSFTATFHLLSSGIGTQTLSLPLAFVYLGWFWGITCLSIAFLWQLYTVGLLVSLHESVPGVRISRYVHLSIVAFGEKLGKFLALFPVLYLSGGTCVMFIITGGGTIKLFYQLLTSSSKHHPLSTTEWFLVFVCIAILVSLFFPNLHSVALVSFVGAIMAVGYCTILWVVFVHEGKADGGVVYDPSESVESESGRVRSIFNALGIIALAFRGHNVVLEIQGTMPSTPNHASSKLMFKGVIASYLIIAMCFFPLAIVGYWAFGNKLPTNGGVIAAISTTLNYNMSKPVLGLIYLQIIISCVAAFQIYSMVVYDNLERIYISKTRQECPKLIRMAIRIFFGGLTFFISVVFPFLPSLGLIIGGVCLQVTFGYPCLMWIAVKRPPVKSFKWWFNLGLGCLGTALGVLVVVGGVWNLVCRGLDANFLHPR